MPTIHELRSFEGCSQVPKQIMEISRRTSLLSSIKISDQVKVMLQEEGYLAVVEDIEENNAKLVLVGFPAKKFVQLLDVLQKFFKVGDGVRVKSGEHIGSISMVTNVDIGGKVGDEIVTIVTFPLREGNHIEIHPFKEHYGKSVTIIAGPLKETSGILRSISTSNVVELEISHSLMVTGHLKNIHVKDFHIHGHSNELPHDSDIQFSMAYSHPDLNICSTPSWEQDIGIGSQTPAWDSSSRTPCITSTSAEVDSHVSFDHIPENIVSSYPLQAMSTTMSPAIIGGVSSRQTSRFNEYWITCMINSDRNVFKGRLLKVIISGMQPNNTSASFENGHLENVECHFLELLRDKKCFRVRVICNGEYLYDVAPEFMKPGRATRMPQRMIVINWDNIQEFRNKYQVYTANDNVTTVTPLRGANRDQKKCDLPTRDLCMYFGP
ncbi:hypothetical protein BDQ17DRAFT_1434609 [Cyathus striatus]|nr:hypothetical protein BDQ17DRAFT_1434609 [Cyathus striatus]